MSTITQAAGELRLVIEGVGFDVYQRFAWANPEGSAIRMAYDGKDLEIMVTSHIHDDFGCLLDRFIVVTADALEIDYRQLRRSTWIRPEIQHGIEADECYIFDPTKLALVNELRARKEMNPAPWPNPDLAVEVDISRPRVDRQGIYAAMKVPELWTFDGAAVIIAQLLGGQYVDTGRSHWLPVTAADVTRWLVEEDSDSVRVWESRLRAWADLLPRAAGGGK